MSTLTVTDPPAAAALANLGLRPCSIESCHQPRYARGWCEPHYRRWLRWGGAEVEAEAPGPREWETSWVTITNGLYELASARMEETCRRIGDLVRERGL